MRNAELHKDHRKRMREKFTKIGLSAFRDHEILEMLLFYTVPRRDTNETGHNLLKEFGSLGGVFSASKQELCKVEGIGDASAEYMGKIRRMLNANDVVWQIGELGKVDAGGGGTVAMYMANRNINTLDAGVPVRPTSLLICGRTFRSAFHRWL